MGAQICSVNKCSFGESNSHKIKFPYFSGRKKPHNFFLALNCFNIQGQDDKSNSNKYIVRRDRKPEFQNSWQAFETGSLGNIKYFLNK